MNEEQLIDILNKTRYDLPHSKSIKLEFLELLCVGQCPDLTDIWNLAEKLSRFEQITIHEMNDIWLALSEMEKDGKCTLADF